MKIPSLLITLSAASMLATIGTVQAGGYGYSHHGMQTYNNDQSMPSAYPPQYTWGIPVMLPPVAPIAPQMPADVANAYEMPATQVSANPYAAVQAPQAKMPSSQPVAETKPATEQAQTPAVNTETKAVAPTKHQVKIVGMTFQPATLTVKAGDIIEWTNESGMPHNVTSQGTSQFASATLNQSMTYALTFAEKGEYPYACTIHPGMLGSIIVE